MELDLRTSVADSYTIPQLVSSHHSVNRRWTHLQPAVDTSGPYSYANQKIIRFRLASNVGMMHPESRIRFDVTYNSSLLLNAALDVGGVHSLFKSIRVILLGNRTEIPAQLDYNRYYALMSNMFQTADEVYSNGSSYGDAVDVVSHSKYSHIFNYSTEFNPQELENIDVYYFDAGEGLKTYLRLYAGPCSPYHQFETGDVVELLLEGQAAAPANGWVNGAMKQVVIIKALPNQRLYEIAVEVAGGTGLVADATFNVSIARIIRQNGSTSANASARQRVCDYTTHTVEFRPNLSILQHVLPLFAMKQGIQIELELANPAECCMPVRCISADNAKWNHDIQVTNPEYVMVMSEPHGNIKEEYIRTLSSPQGLTLYTPGVDVFRVVGSTASTESFQIYSGRRSARKLYMIMQSSSMERGGGEITANSPSISHAFRAKLSKFQVQIGGVHYPADSIEVSDALGAEAFNFLMEANLTDQFNNAHTGPEDARANYPANWTLPVNGDFGQRFFYDAGNAYYNNESQFFCVGVNLSRDPDMNGLLTGVALNGNAINVRIERSGSVGGNDQVGIAPGELPGKIVYYVFICYDGVLQMKLDRSLFLA